MANTFERFEFSPRTKNIYEGVLKRLKPNRVREGTRTGPVDDGRTPFADVFERHRGEPYIISLAYAIVESWLVSEPLIFDDDIIIGYPRPERNVFEYFAWGIMYDESRPDERIEDLRDEMFPLDDRYKDEEGVRIFGSEEAYETVKSGGLWSAGGFQGHTVSSYEKLLRLGIGGTVEQIDHYDALTPESDTKKKNFYKACRIIMNGMSEWILMHARKAERLSRELANPIKKERLAKIAETCVKVSWEVPETFLEASQLMWFFCLWDWVDCVGRFDQYMYRFYKGHEDDEIITAMVMKFWEHGVHNITLSGVHPEDGTDATNEISYHILQVLRTMHETHPRLTVRVHENTPEDLMKLVVTMWSEGMSDPTLASDKNVVEGLMGYGVPLHDARDYTILGCQEIEIPGKSNFGCTDGVFNIAKVLEYTLNNGRDRFNGVKISLDTGNLTTYKTFDELWNAYESQIKHLVPIFVELSNRGVDIKAANVSKLVKSTMTEACVERGLSLDEGGAVYNYGVIETAGAAAVADSLYAIKTLVYDEKKISAEELEKALTADFEGYEEIRQALLSVPKYGNNDEGSDAMAAKVLEMFWTEIGKYKSRRGGVFTGACALLDGGIGYGEKTWALPDGRHKGEPLGNTIGPRTGSDKSGLTAMVSSVAKMPLKLGVGGTTCNVLIPTYLMATDELKSDIMSLMKTFMMMGGQLAQITTASLEDMKDAQIHPENHEDLIVRIGGFSMRFIEFEKGEQDEFIMRYAS